MPSTNATKVQDPEKQALASTISHLSRTSSSLSNKDTSSPELERQPKSKMSKIHHIFLCGVVLFIFTYTVASTAANGALKTTAAQQRLRFQELLDSVEPAALHEVLHEHMKEKYKHGVYQEDKKAMEVVHQTMPEVALSLVELARRQSSNSTIAPPPSSSAIVVVPDTSTSVPVTPSTTPTVPTTPSPTPSTTPTQQPTSQTPSTQAQRPTTTAVQPTQTTPVPTTPGTTVVPTTPATTRTSANPATTPSTLTTQRSSANVPQSTTPQPGTTTSPSPTSRGSVTQQIVYTTTVANGQPTTITSFTVVPADQAENTGSATKTNPNASLQTNSGNSRSHLGLTGVLGAIGVVVVGAL